MRSLSMTSATPAKQVWIEVDGRPVQAEPGISVAAALMRAGIRALRLSPAGAPRGAFCMMGVCQECQLDIDGRRQQACLIAIEPGMRLVTGMQA